MCPYGFGCSWSKFEPGLAQLPMRPNNSGKFLCAFMPFGNAEPVMILLTVWRHMEDQDRRVFYGSNMGSGRDEGCQGNVSHYHYPNKLLYLLR